MKHNVYVHIRIHAQNNKVDHQIKSTTKTHHHRARLAILRLEPPLPLRADGADLLACRHHLPQQGLDLCWVGGGWWVFVVWKGVVVRLKCKGGGARSLWVVGVRCLLCGREGDGRGRGLVGGQIDLSLVGVWGVEGGGGASFMFVCQAPIYIHITKPPPPSPQTNTHSASPNRGSTPSQSPPCALQCTAASWPARAAARRRTSAPTPLAPCARGRRCR